MEEKNEKYFEFAKGAITDAIEQLDNIIEQPENTQSYDKASEAQVKLQDILLHL